MKAANVQCIQRGATFDMFADLQQLRLPAAKDADTWS